MVIAPSLRESSGSTSSRRSMSVTRPRPSQRGHMPSGPLKLKALEVPTCGVPRRLKMMRSIVYASVAVPTVERELAPIRSWSTTMAALRLRSSSTSGRASLGISDCSNAVYVSLISRCDSAAMVPKTREDLPEPETPVKTVSLRLGRSSETLSRLFSLAPRTSITSCRSAAVRVSIALPDSLACKEMQNTLCRKELQIGGLRRSGRCGAVDGPALGRPAEARRPQWPQTGTERGPDRRRRDRRRRRTGHDRPVHARRRRAPGPQRHGPLHLRPWQDRTARPHVRQGAGRAPHHLRPLRRLATRADRLGPRRPGLLHPPPVGPAHLT